MALAALEATVKQFRGDRARLYLTGLSMGGYGTFGLGVRQSGKFAALVPFCGGVRLPRRPNLLAVEEPAGDPYAATTGKIGKTPIWIFHGSVGHDSWDKAYGETELWTWLFEQRLSR